MARKRLIDTDGLYFSTELVEILGDRGLHLYIRLWGIAEDWGGYEPKYADIALQMGALKFTSEETEGFINKLINKKKIAVYEKDDRKVHWIVNFLEHQPLDNPSLPKLPLPDWIKCKILSYKSGKKYANYRLIKSRLPVGYSSATGNGVTVTVTKQNSNSNSKETILSGRPDLMAPIEYLNQKAKRNFDPKNKSNQDLIRARYNEGRTLENLKKVIDIKTAKWLGDPKMKDYLRPSTLFNRVNFENYLNETPICPKCKGKGKYTSVTGYEILCECTKKD